MKFFGWLPKSNLTFVLWYTILQMSNEINPSLQKLLSGNNIFILYFTPITKTGHNLAKILPMITNLELDLYFTMIYPSANFQYNQCIPTKVTKRKPISTKQQKLSQKGP